MSTLKLIGTDGSRYYAFELKAGRMTIGRKPEADLCIPDKTVSREHAELEISENGGGCYVTDLQSHNGTTVNGVRVSNRKEIKPGDSVRFGQTEFKLTSNQESASEVFRPTAPQLSDIDLEKSIVLSLNEALKPLPAKVTDLPHFFSTLSEMARMLVLPEPKETMLERSLGLVAKMIPCDRLAVLMRNSSDELYIAASLLPGGRDPGKFTLSQTILSEIMAKKNAVLMGDAHHDDRFANQQSIVQLELNSAMAVPLFDQDVVLGVLYVDTKNPLHRYSDDYLRLLATFGNIIASRLLNYELLEKRAAKEIIDSEMQRAASIQQKLLNKESPVIEGYSLHAYQEPCLTVGGDLYDLACLADGRLFFLVGDVSGKGLGAALLMSNILASFRILYKEPGFDLGRAVKQCSLQLFEYSAPTDFATLFAGVIDPKANTLSYINAGHNAPLVIRHNGAIEYLKSCGPMIGAFDFSAWEPCTLDLGPRDLVFVYTDGVTEAEHGNEQFGEGRMEQSLKRNVGRPPSEIAAALVEELLLFIGDSPRSDDITMLLVKRN